MLMPRFLVFGGFESLFAFTLVGSEFLISRSRITRSVPLIASVVPFWPALMPPSIEAHCPGAEVIVMGLPDVPETSAWKSPR